MNETLFKAGLAYKGIRLCVSEAEKLGVSMALGAAARETLAITNSFHGGGSDDTSISRVVET